MKKTLFALLALGFAGTASADAINSFTWDTYSSDDKMYVCNVGIRHERGTEGHVDENAGGANSGATRTSHDYLTVTYSTLNNDQQRGPEVTRVIEAGVSSTAYTQLVRDADAHKIVVTSLQVNLASENYGAKYYVDVCYRGNQIDFAGNNIRTAFKLKHNQLTYSDHANAGNLNYFSEAQLAVSSKTVCDTQAVGRNLGYDNGLNFNQADMNIATAAGDIRFTAGERRLTSGTQAIQFVSPYRPVTLNRSSTDAPRYCKTRYEVAEKRVKVAATPSRAGYCHVMAYSRRYGRYITQSVPGNFSSAAQCYNYARTNTMRYGYPYYFINHRVRAFRPTIQGTAAVLQERNWTRMGGRFTALTEIENHGSN